jgi:hypothetical protein
VAASISTTDRDESRALAQLAFTELGRAVGGIADMHRAIAHRAFTASGPGARPAHVVHDAISDGVYAAVRGAAGAAGWGASRLVASGAGAHSETPRGAAALAVLNGLIGDQLEREDSDLPQPLAIRVGGRAIVPGRDALAAAFPAATPRLVIFLHGLMETEFAWRLGDAEPYAARLARDLGVTPIEFRYNTGLHISENGRALAALLDDLVAAWPVDVQEIALVGHSMGGLVARSACHVGGEDVPAAALPGGARSARQPGVRPSWTDRVGHVISLGSPHHGAPLAQGVHLAAAALDAVPETRPFGGFLRRRSAGIRDLRHGSLVDDDWRDQDPDALRARACKEVPLLPGATHCFVAATITASPRNPLGRLIGDALVLAPSASGRGRTRRIPFHDEHGLHLGGAHHLALLNHPAVYERLHNWLSAPSVRPATPPASRVRP